MGALSRGPVFELKRFRRSFHRFDWVDEQEGGRSRGAVRLAGLVGWNGHAARGSEVGLAAF